MPSGRTCFRNAALGAALASMDAVVIGVKAMGAGRLDEARHLVGPAVALMVGGALAGLTFTLLAPVRRRGRAGRYLGWILSSYVVVGTAVLVGIGIRDQTTAAMITNPFGLTLVVVCATVGGIMACRVLEE